jgi:hypothetical protein
MINDTVDGDSEEEESEEEESEEGREEEEEEEEEKMTRSGFDANPCRKAWSRTRGDVAAETTTSACGCDDSRSRLWTPCLRSSSRRVASIHLFLRSRVQIAPSTASPDRSGRLTRWRHAWRSRALWGPDLVAQRTSFSDGSSSIMAAVHTSSYLPEAHENVQRH